MNRYRAIGFDYGGVIEGRPGTFFNKMICATLDIDLTTYEKVYFSHNKAHNGGELISQDEMWRRILSDLNMNDKYTLLINSIEEYKVSNRIINKDVLEIIHSLKKQGYKLGLLTNNAVSVGQRLRDEQTHKLFEAFIVSAEVNLSKPDPRIFQMLADQLQVNMEELIYIDDTQKSLSTAAECGYTPILFNDALQLTEELRRLGIAT